MTNPYVGRYKDGWAVWRDKSAYPWQLPLVYGKTPWEVARKYKNYMGKKIEIDQEFWT